MGNPDRAESSSVDIKSSDVCLKMLGRNKAQINYLLKTSHPPLGPGQEVPVPAEAADGLGAEVGGEG